MARKPVLLKVLDRINNDKQFKRDLKYLRENPEIRNEVIGLKHNYTQSDLFQSNLLSSFILTLAPNDEESDDVDDLTNNYKMIKVWEKTGHLYYRVGEAFGKELFDAKMPISTESLHPYTGKCVFIEFPKPFKSSSADSYFSGIFLHLVDPSSLYRGFGPYSDSHHLIGVAVAFSSDGDVGFSNGGFPLPAGKDIEDVLRSVDFGDDEEDRKLTAFIAKCFLYIHSGDPDLRHLRPEKFTRQERNKIEKENDIIFQCPQILVSWNWIKPSLYHKGQWVRTGHERKQRCGPGLTQVKLIWIEEKVCNRKAGPVAEPTSE